MLREIKVVKQYSYKPVNENYKEIEVVHTLNSSTAVEKCEADGYFIKPTYSCMLHSSLFYLVRVRSTI